MTNNQIEQEIINIKEHQAKSEIIIEELKEDVKATKSLAEDVHIMAINMESMQKTLESTNKKVDALSNKDFNNYQENKKIIKDKVVSAIGGAIGTGVIGLIIWLINTFIK